MFNKIIEVLVSYCFMTFIIILIMKIWGIGVDLVQNSRISNVLDKSHARRFLTRVLHPEELTLFDTIKPQKIQVQFVASRWAVK